MARDNVVSLGERLKQRREELGLSQVQAARELDVARTAYRLWEMEAAKPAPDRWRLISRWLGISVATMLLAEELIDRDEAADIEQSQGRFGDIGAWDRSASREPGDFFAQERSMIARETEAGALSGADLERLGAMYGRVQRSSVASSTRGWPQAELTKSLAPDAAAPGLGRAAVRATASGVADAAMEEAELLASELITSSVRRAEGSDQIVLRVLVGRGVLRVEVQDTGARTVRSPGSDGSAGWGMSVVDGIAARWGAGREAGVNTTWFELDIARPGATG